MRNRSESRGQTMSKIETVASVVAQSERLLHHDELDAVNGGIQDEENFTIRDVTMLVLANFIARAT